MNLQTSETKGDSRRIRILLNRRAGTVLEVGEENFERRLEHAFEAHGVEATVLMTAPEELADRFALELSSDAKGDVVVAGGDGSLNAVLPFLQTTRRSIGVLPLGTVNLIGRDLGMASDIETNAATLAHGRAIDVDLVMVNGIPFHSNAGIGWFVTMAVERDTARRQFPFSRQISFALAGLRTLFRAMPIEVEFQTNGASSVRRADAVIITNNRFKGSPPSRQRLDEGVLEIHVIDAPTIASRMRTLIAVIRGTWQDLKGIDSFVATRVVLKRKRRRRGLIAVDGELLRCNYPLTFEIKPRAIRLISALHEPDLGGRKTMPP